MPHVQDHDDRSDRQDHVKWHDLEADDEGDDESERPSYADRLARRHSISSVAAGIPRCCKISAMADDEALEIRAAWVPLRPWILVALPLVLLALASLLSRSRVLLLVALVGLVLGLVVQLLFSWSRNREGPAMVLDRAGIEVRGYPRVSWSDVEKVVVSKFQVRGSRALGWLTTLQNGVVVSFVPRPGVRMPPPPGGLKRELSSWELVRQTRYGTNLTVVPSFFNASARRIARAAHHLGSIPVEGDSNQ